MVETKEDGSRGLEGKKWSRHQSAGRDVDSGAPRYRWLRPVDGGQSCWQRLWPGSPRRDLPVYLAYSRSAGHRRGSFSPFTKKSIPASLASAHSVPSFPSFWHRLCVAKSSLRKCRGHVARPACVCVCWLSMDWWITSVLLQFWVKPRLKF